MKKLEPLKIGKFKQLTQKQKLLLWGGQDTTQTIRTFTPDKGEVKDTSITDDSIHIYDV